MLKEPASYFAKNGKVKGMLTITSNMVIFEPNLDDPNVVQHGLFSNQVHIDFLVIYPLPVLT